MVGFPPPTAHGLGVRLYLTLGLRPSAITLLLIPLLCSSLDAADFERSRQQYRSGEYTECIHTTALAIAKREYSASWPILKATSELTLGRDEDALATIEGGLHRHTWNIRLMLLGYRANLNLGRPDPAQEHLKKIISMARRAPWRYTDAEDYIALGEAALLDGADAREVLDGFFERARSRYPNHPASYIAIARLAIDKHDAELAADILQAALKRFPEEADIHFGLARAISNPNRSTAELTAALDLNPRHIPSLLMKAERLIEAEKYTTATTQLGHILKINPRHPQAWAFRAVIAHLNNNTKAEATFRQAAHGLRKTDPAVDSLIGRKLSQHYRFREGAGYQRRALAADKTYLPAKIQLSRDLLHLGEEEEGWKLAAQAHQRDGYDVSTFNLLELRDRIADYRKLESDGFVVTMESREAAVYGPRVLALLGRAKRTLCAKYGLNLKQTIAVEIFPDENDFAVRTFGMPAVGGYLGVCFGSVITANSPASRNEHPANWEAVLWHEFCHVVTLQLTRNKMPRWLSEGISVYEEGLANPNWGQRMNPQYREMILDGGLTPVGSLSSAFLSPPSPLHLQFAYYQSSLVVEFLVDRYGLNALQHILGDLGNGLRINDALSRHTVDIPRLEHDFEQFARQRAEQLGPDVDWSHPDLTALLNDDGDALGEFVKKNPNNFFALKAQSQRLIENGESQQAVAILQRLVHLYHDDISSDNAHLQLARIHREQNDLEQERTHLAELAARDADALHVFLRLIELDLQRNDWQSVKQNAAKAISVNPLVPQPHRALARAAEQLGDNHQGIAAYRTLIAMEPDNMAELHFRLASLLHLQQHPDAKRHVLTALAAAPRYRAAHRLLLKIHRQKLETLSDKPAIAIKPKTVKLLE